MIEGRVEGKVDLKQNNVTVGKNGRVKADVFGKVVVIEGEVDGNVFAREQAILRQAGAIRGNITAPRVILEDGSRFKGSIDMEAPKEMGGRARPARHSRASPEANRPESRGSEGHRLMSWFSPRGPAPRKEQGRSQATVEPELHRSLAFAALCEEIRRRKMQVLDLGSAVGSNVEFFSQFGCKLFIEDLYTALSTRASRRGRARGSRLLRRIPLDPAGDAFRRHPRLGPVRLPPAQGARRLLRAAPELHQPRRADLLADLVPQDHPGATLPLPDPRRAAPRLRTAHRGRAPLSPPRPGRGHQSAQRVPRGPVVPAEARDLGVSAGPGVGRV